ncbi:uncharacterized protein LOC143888944 [Tasmannia lanceolata]|uniref:uncharacterized protein LOC143859718 n=1 Tax=Tasmannia lanceolata TaxID=3420 RepID=UPI004064BD73
MGGIANVIQNPWISLGDFNAIRFSEENWGGADPVQHDMDDFNMCIDNCSLTDLRAVGQSLSWNNSSRTGNLKLRRLDRALVNVEWLTSHPKSVLLYKNPGLSDHAPIIITLCPKESSGGKPFKFHNMWLSDHSLYPIVEQAWYCKIKGNPLFRLSKKLQNVKHAIKEWNKNVFRRVDIKAPLLKQNLDNIQSQLAGDPANLALRQEELTAREEYRSIANQEEQLYHQKSRIDWLNLGDSNTAFFHAAMAMRRNQNSIHGIQLPNGEISTDQSVVEETIVNHFKDLLNHNQSLMNDVPEPLFPLPAEEANHLIRPFTPEEIKDSRFRVDGNRAPGPDGFNGNFFKRF